MFTDRDRTYFERRYEEELHRAVEASDPALGALHARWADLYRQRLAASRRN